MRSIYSLLALMLATPALAQDLLPKAPPQTKPVLIVNATIHPIAGPTIDSGIVTFKDGKLDIIAADSDPRAGLKVESDAWDVIDAKGKHVYPGLIAAYSQLGLIEIAALRQTVDFGEVGQATPEVRAAIAVNPDSTLLPVARAGGVLVAGIFPLTGAYTNNSYIDGPGGMVPGRAGVIKLDGWTSEQMAESLDCGLVINWPQMRPLTARWMNRSREEQLRETDQTIAILDRLFSDAAAYRAAKLANPSSPSDLRLDAMSALLPAAPSPATGGGGAASAASGGGGMHTQHPVFVLANDYDQIASAVSFADKHKLKLVIVGGQDTPLAADLLKARDIPVIVLGVYRFPKRADGDYDEPFANAAKLKEAGVRFCISSGEEAANERNLPLAAATSVAFGLPRDDALRAITLSAAEILGVNANLGSLAPGKSATLIITDKDLFDTTHQVEHAWIDGRKIDLTTKQTELEAKYREKYRQLGK